VRLLALRGLALGLEAARRPAVHLRLRP
jgi:hypothetical protein